MTTTIIFDIVGSEIDHIKRQSSFKHWGADGKLTYDDDDSPSSYFNYELHAAQPAIDWCHDNGIEDFTVENAKYAMQLAFIFKHIEDAMAFKLRWWNKRCDIS